MLRFFLELFRELSTQDRCLKNGDIAHLFIEAIRIGIN